MKLEPWEIVRNKLLGVEIFGNDDTTLNDINRDAYVVQENTGQYPDEIYITKIAYSKLMEDNKFQSQSYDYYGNKFRKIVYYGYPGIIEIREAP